MASLHHNGFAHSENWFVDKAQRVKPIGDTLPGANHFKVHCAGDGCGAPVARVRRSGVKTQSGGEQLRGFPMLVDKLPGLRQLMNSRCIISLLRLA